MRTHLNAASRAAASFAFAFALFAITLPAQAQRAAIASDLSPEAASAAFEDAVIKACLPAVGGGQRLAQLPEARRLLAPTNDAEAIRQLGARPDETVWSAIAARGVVAVKESAGRCTASVYGPRAQPIMSSLAQKLVGAGFERLVSPATGFRQMLAGVVNGRRVQAVIVGSEPGTPGHQSRFPVITATLFVTP